MLLRLRPIRRSHRTTNPPDSTDTLTLVVLLARMARTADVATFTVADGMTAY
jgi:hypothetical protein